LWQSQSLGKKKFWLTRWLDTLPPCMGPGNKYRYYILWLFGFRLPLLPLGAQLLLYISSYTPGSFLISSFIPHSAILLRSRPYPSPRSLVRLGQVRSKRALLDTQVGIQEIIYQYLRYVDRQARKKKTLRQQHCVKARTEENSNGGKTKKRHKTPILHM